MPSNSAEVILSRWRRQEVLIEPICAKCVQNAWFAHTKNGPFYIDQ